NWTVTEQQWRAIRVLAPLEPGEAPVRWDPLVRWAVRFAESINLDAEERAYKLEIADNLRKAADAVRSNEEQWPTLLRRAFGSPNNLTAWRMHGAFLTWVRDNLDDARTLLLALWD